MHLLFVHLVRFVANEILHYLLPLFDVQFICLAVEEILLVEEVNDFSSVGSDELIDALIPLDHRCKELCCNLVHNDVVNLFCFLLSPFFFSIPFTSSFFVANVGVRQISLLLAQGLLQDGDCRLKDNGETLVLLIDLMRSHQVLHDLAEYLLKSDDGEELRLGQDIFLVDVVSTNGKPDLLQELRLLVILRREPILIFEQYLHILEDAWLIGSSTVHMLELLVSHLLQLGVIEEY